MPMLSSQHRPLSLLFSTLTVTFLLGVGYQSSYAQKTYEWTDANGGVYGTFTDWSPAGAPGPNDVARFNLNADYTVSLIQSRQARLMQVLRGEVVLQGTGIHEGDRTFALEDVLVNPNAELMLSRGSGSFDRGLTLSTSDDMTVRGLLSVSSGTELNNASALIDSASPNLVGSVVIASVNANNEPSTWTATT